LAFAFDLSPEPGGVYDNCRTTGDVRVLPCPEGITQRVSSHESAGEGAVGARGEAPERGVRHPLLRHEAPLAQHAGRTPKNAESIVGRCIGHFRACVQRLPRGPHFVLHRHHDSTSRLHQGQLVVAEHGLATGHMASHDFHCPVRPKDKVNRHNHAGHRMVQKLVP